MDKGGYVLLSTGIAWVASVVTFFGCWIYCISTYGFLLGVGLGWLPSGIVAAIVFPIAWAAWPAVAIGIAFLVLSAAQR